MSVHDQGTGIDALSDDARSLLQGAIDIHAHAAPDPYATRLLDSRALVRAAHEAGMGGIVLKSHEYATQPLAWALDQGFEGIRVYGALSLDHGVGGLNAEAVRVSLRIGARVVWMPTFDAVAWRQRGGTFRSPGGPVPVMDVDGNLLAACHDVLDVIQEHDAVLASGHLSPAEQLSLLREARRRGIRCVVTHATFSDVPVEAQRELAGLGCYIEQCAVALFLPDQAGVQRILDDVRAVGPEHVILSTDLGQATNPPPPLGFGLWMGRFLSEGFSIREVARMTRENPATLLG